MMMGVCPPLAMLIGGQLHTRLGWQANFWLIAALAVALFVAALKGLPSSRPLRPQPVRSPPAPPAPASWTATPGSAGSRSSSFVIVLGLTSASFYSFLGGAPLVLANQGVNFYHL